MAKSLHCSFCGKSEHEVAKLAAGPADLYICDECVDVCRLIMDGETAMARAFDPTGWSRERLLAVVGPLDATARGHRRHLQQVVESLRTQGVSWAAIAAKMGVSRQSAWERFKGAP